MRTSASGAGFRNSIRFSPSNNNDCCPFSWEIEHEEGEYQVNRLSATFLEAVADALEKKKISLLLYSSYVFHFASSSYHNDCTGVAVIKV